MKNRDHDTVTNATATKVVPSEKRRNRYLPDAWQAVVERERRRAQNSNRHIPFYNFLKFRAEIAEIGNPPPEHVVASFRLPIFNA